MNPNQIINNYRKDVIAAFLIVLTGIIIDYNTQYYLLGWLFASSITALTTKKES